MSNTTYITALLDDWRDGNLVALNRLFPLVYRELDRIARRQLRLKDSLDTISPAALVNEAFLKMVEEGRVRWRDRKHFLTVCASAMRPVLVRCAQAKRAGAAGGPPGTAQVDKVRGGERKPDMLIALDEALTQLANIEARMARVVELRFFGGLTESEVANVLNIKEQTARSDWYKAKTLLCIALAEKRAYASTGAAAR